MHTIYDMNIPNTVVYNLWVITVSLRLIDAHIDSIRSQISKMTGISLTIPPGREVYFSDEEIKLNMNHLSNRLSAGSNLAGWCAIYLSPHTRLVSTCMHQCEILCI